MSWYWIVLLIILYCIIWIATSISLSRLAKNSDFGWTGIGMVWPLVIATIPLIILIFLVGKLVEVYGGKEERK